jgi:hypothetical protein
MSASHVEPLRVEHRMKATVMAEHPELEAVALATRRLAGLPGAT